MSSAVGGASHAKLAAKIQQDASFFDSMLGLVPSTYYAPPMQQDTNSKTADDQDMKAGSEGEEEAQEQSDEEGQDDEEEDEQEEEDDDDEMADSEQEKPQSNSKNGKQQQQQQSSKQNKPAQNGSAKGNAGSQTNGPARAPFGGAALSTNSLPLPTLHSLTANVGMDALRQKLHERIQGLSQKRKPEDHPFAKKRKKKDETDKKKNREKNDKKPTVHRGADSNKKAATAKGDSDVEVEAPRKKQKGANGTAVSASSSSPSLVGASAPKVRASDLLDQNDFQFAEFKTLTNPLAKPGSHSLAGKQARKKKAGDEAALARVEEFESRVAELKASGRAQDAEKLQQERAMHNALLRTQGIKVKDDPKLLKKSIKRDEKKKEKSRAAWAERTTAQKKVQDQFHAEKIASANKKIQGDRSKRGSTKETEAAAAAAKETPKERAAKMTRKERAAEFKQRSKQRPASEKSDKGSQKKK